MDKYNTIAEYLQEAVNTGELSLEEASMINDAAYERYVESEDSDMITVEEALDLVEDILFTEGNAYNKYANKLQKDINTLRDKNTKITDLLGEDKAGKLLGDRNRKMVLKMSDFAADSGNHIDKYNRKGSKSSSLYSNDREEQKDMKQTWMLNNGNRGESPEKKYVAGRYLKAQKELRELDPGRKKIK